MTETEVLVLSEEDTKMVVEALESPPKLNERFMSAAKHYKESVDEYCKE